MKLTLSNRAVLLGLALTASTSLVLAAQAPVIDVSSTPITNQSSGSISEQLANVERKLDVRNLSLIHI